MKERPVKYHERSPSCPMFKKFISFLETVKQKRKRENFLQKRRKSIISRYREILKKRKSEDFQREWLSANADYNPEVLKSVSQIMEWPTHYIFPHDRMEIVFMNNSTDMREVEAMLSIEKLLNREIDPENLPIVLCDLFK